MDSRPLIAVTLMALTAATAEASVLYKSVGPNGTVMFSDTPPMGESRVVEQRVIPDFTSESAKGGSAGNGAAASGSGSSSESGLPIYQSVEFDGAIAKASAAVDAAEHALALARRDVWRPVEGLRLTGLSRKPADDDRVEFYKKELAAARKALMEAIREKQQAGLRWDLRERQLASR